MTKQKFSFALMVAAAAFIAQPSAFAANDSTSGNSSAAPDTAVPPKQAAALLKALQEQNKRLEAHEQALEKQRHELDKQEQSFSEERSEFLKLQQKVAALTGKPIETASSKKSSSPKDPQFRPGVRPAVTPEEVGTDRRPEGQDRPPEVAVVTDQGGIMMKKGTAVFTPGLQYTHSSATSVAVEGFAIIPALNIGVFQISQVDRDILTASASGRLALTNRLEIDAKIPYVYRQDSTRTRPIGTPTATETASTVSSEDIGDVEAGIHYQINDAKHGWPFFIGNLRVKANTGTSPFEIPIGPNGIPTGLATGSGFWAVQPSLTTIYPSDPAVFYSNIGYLHNFSQSFNNFGEIEPGDSLSGSFGMSLALNEKSSFSVGYSHNTVFPTQQNGHELPNSTNLQVGTLDVGYSYNLSERTNFNFTVSAGLTHDAPDVTVLYRIPISFDLF
jgi:hypothetical protein